MTTKKITKEPQNQQQIDTYVHLGPVSMGPWTSHIWRDDPKHLLFLLARYKFCARMLIGKSNIVEIGCGDAFGTSIVLQTVKTIHCIDIEPLVLSEAKKHMQSQFAERCDFTLHDIICDPIPGLYDAAYSLDVIEHIQPDIETQFFKNICASLKKDAICIIGTPNLCASKHASTASMEGHINLKSEETLRSLMLKYFENVLVFSMNDEIIHTGYFPMAHYIMAVGASVKNDLDAK